MVRPWYYFTFKYGACVRALGPLTYRFSLLLAGLLLAVSSGSARQMVFRTIGGEQGLVQNTVNTIAQDSRGFVWIGTQGGLHRFDGFQMVHYQHKPGKKYSLPDNLITALTPDNDGGLWVGTASAGLSHYNPKTERFEVLAQPPPDGSALILAIAEVPKQGLWVATSKSLSFWPNYQSSAADVLMYYEPGSVDSVVSLLLHDDLGLVIGTKDSGIFRYLNGVLTGLSFPNADARPPMTTQLASDRLGRLFACTDQGLFVKELTEIGFTAVPALREPCGALALTSTGALWLNVLGKGLTRLDQNLTQRENYLPKAGQATGLPEGIFNALLMDRSDTLWVGTRSSGVTVADAEGAFFSHIADVNEAEKNVAAGFASDLTVTQGFNDVRSMTQIGKFYLTGTESGLLRVYDQAHKLVRRIELLPLLRSPSPGRSHVRILALSVQRDTLWLGTNAGLLSTSIDVDGNISELVASKVLSASTVRALAPSADGSLWVGTSDAGLYRMDGHERVLEHHLGGVGQEIPGNRVMSVFEDPDGRVFVGTFDGMAVRGKNQPRFLSYFASDQDPRSLPGNLIRSIVQLSDGKIWFATHSGLARLDRTDEADSVAPKLRFSRFTTEDGLPNNVVYALAEDTQRRIWLSGNLGLTLFEPALNRFSPFSMGDGLQGLEFNGNSVLTLADNTILFGGINGFNVFQPNDFRPSSFETPVRIFGLQRGRNRGYGILHHDSLTMRHDERVLSLRFGGLDYRAPERAKIAYKLEGFDQDWVFQTGLGQETYTNLPHGNYVFRVRATNRDQVWSQSELSFAIRVLPAWWEHFAFRVFLVVLAMAAIAASLWLRRRRLRAKQRMVDELRESDERMRLCLAGSRDCFWIFHGNTNTIQRDGTVPVLGPGRDGIFSVEQYFSEHIHPDDVVVTRRVFADILIGRTNEMHFEQRVLHANGDWVWVAVSGQVSKRNSKGRILQIAGTARNIEAQRASARELVIAGRILGRISEGVIVTDFDGTIVNINPAGEVTLGYAFHDVWGVHVSMLRSPRHDEQQFKAMLDAVERDDRWRGELWLKRRDDSDVLVNLEINRIEGDEREPSICVWVISDITDRKRAEEELRFLANFDALTSLPNRTMFLQRLTRGISRAKRHQLSVAVVFVDLDRFKQINDSLGHAAGDELLRGVANRLKAAVREIDTAARLAGDEFVLILEELNGPQDADLAAMRVLRQFAEPFNLFGQDVVVSPSIGIALFPRDAERAEELLKCADLAMYSAKAAGRNTMRSYTREQSRAALERAATERQLRTALDREQFEVFYQPCFDLRSGAILGAEALLRWRHPSRGLVSPDAFIPILEESGQIVAVGEWVLETALAQLRNWDHLGLQMPFVAVNVSLVQLARGRISDWLPAALARNQLDGSRLSVELTESIVMTNPEESIEALQAISAAGVGIAVDDFGTGYSSLSYLKRLPIDKLKIDKAFVHELEKDADDQAIVRSVIALSEALRLQVIAEGVESEAQREILMSLGCFQGQGFLFSSAVPASSLTQMLRDRLGQERNTVIFEDKPEAKGDTPEL